jgi:hypothetical protein
MTHPGFAQHCKFEVPEIIFGRGLLGQVGACARRLGGKKVFLVSDQGLFRAGWVDLAMKSLLDAGLAFVYFDQITSNPKDYEIEAGAAAYAAAGADVIVGLGGGSAMDAAKGIAILVSNGASIHDYIGTDKVNRPLPPLVLCPTTCGTGSDVSQFAVINNSKERYKYTIMSRCIAPDISLTDPDTLHTLPDEYLRASALDALTHAVEAYFSVAASSLTDVNALQGHAPAGEQLGAGDHGAAAGGPGRPVTCQPARRDVLLQRPARGRPRPVAPDRRALRRQPRHRQCDPAAGGAALRFPRGRGEGAGDGRCPRPPPGREPGHAGADDPGDHPLPARRCAAAAQPQEHRRAPAGPGRAGGQGRAGRLRADLPRETDREDLLGLLEKVF